MNKLDYAMVSEIDELDFSMSALNCGVSDPNKVSDKSWLLEYIQEKERQIAYWKSCNANLATAAAGT